MILFGIILGLVLGAVAGRSLNGLFEIRLRWISLIFLALALRIGTQVAIAGGVQLAADFRLPLREAVRPMRETLPSPGSRPSSCAWPR